MGLVAMLSRFQVELLVAVAENPMSRGLAIMENVEENTDIDEVRHGRTYPQLDNLQEMGLINKHVHKQDNRSNAYEITTDGIKALEALEKRIENGLEKAYVTR